uniref:BACK domain-containing protein n=1 Tax=Steinernema glaseri TaxID=37863 RepID=A0A1I7ZI63_9BILA
MFFGPFAHAHCASESASSCHSDTESDDIADDDSNASSLADNHGNREGDSGHGLSTRVTVPDVTPVAFETMIQFLYSDQNPEFVKLDDDIVMLVLYAAKKYGVTRLVSCCIDYLMKSLDPSNAVCLLSQARFFNEDFLVQRCLQVIDENTDEALQSPGLAEIDRDTLKAILRRSELDPSNELVIFRAASSWAEAECERMGLTATPANLRAALGQELLSLIRFPLMNVHEFGQAASTSLLTCEEIAQVFLYLTVKPQPPISYSNRFRCNSRSRHIVHRFNQLSLKRCTKRENRILFTTDRDILVSALGVYGMGPMNKTHIAYMDEKVSTEWCCQVEIQLNPAPDSREIAGGHNTFDSVSETVQLTGVYGDTKPLMASFSKPVAIPSGVTYMAAIRFVSDSGVQTYAGKEGAETVSVELPYGENVSFKFQSFRNSYGNDDGGKYEGQIPAIHFFIQWPKDE